MYNDPNLIAIVSALVKHWGAPQVRRAVELEIAEKIGGSGSAVQRRRAENKKISAVKIAERLSQNVKNRHEIVELAQEFENKKFLPRIGDAKDFLEANGQDTAGLKDRIAAFRRVVTVLKRLPASQLRSLRDDTLHSGPMRLGPLSDAIGAAGSQIREKRQVTLRFDSPEAGREFD